jgi:hypothetical protein
MWRELDAGTRRTLIEQSASLPPFAVVIFARRDNKLPTFEAAKRCDPHYDHHFKAHFLAEEVGIIQGLSLARLEPLGIGRTQLEEVWRNDASLREGLIELMRRAYGDEADLTAAGPETLALLQAAWVRLGRLATKPLTGGAPELAAGSYWMARAWETLAIEPMTRRAQPAVS